MKNPLGKNTITRLTFGFSLLIHGKGGSGGEGVVLFQPKWGTYGGLVRQLWDFASKLFSIGKQVVNSRIEAYYNVVQPDGAPEWNTTFTFQFLFPK